MNKKTLEVGVILKLAEVGMKLCYVGGNRGIGVKNLKQKVDSIKESGQLMPIIVEYAIVALEEGLNLYDCLTGEAVTEENADDYLVIIDGQHRNAAIMALQDADKKKGTKFAPSDVFFMLALNPKKLSIKKQISECNIFSVIWDGKDYLTDACLCNPTSELLQYAKELSDLNITKSGEGYRLTTISLILTFTKNLNKEILAKSMEEGVGVLPSGDIERGKRYVKTARSVGFSDNYLRSRFLIEWFIDEVNKDAVNGLENAFEKLDSLSSKQMNAIQKLKSSTLEAIREIADNS